MPAPSSPSPAIDGRLAAYCLANAAERRAGMCGLLKLFVIDCTGRSRHVSAHAVAGKREARAAAIACGATPWNF